MQADPRFQGSNFYKLPAWYILKVWDFHTRQYHKRINDQSRTQASVASILHSLPAQILGTKNGSFKPIPPESFLPFRLQQDSENQELKNNLSPSTAQILSRLIKDKRLPGHVERLIKHSDIWQLVKNFS